MLKIILVICLMMSHLALASSRQVIDTLGISPKGQFIALEEYGYKVEKRSFYVTIKILNVWKKEYVGKPIWVEIPALRPQYLTEARAKAKLLAQDELKRFQISG
jgi:predicted secreted protein